MIPLLFIALALSAAALAYEASPKVRGQVDDYARALRAAHAAHQAADGHLTAARAAPDPAIAAQYARAAMAANQAAAQKTIAAARAALTVPQRAAVAESAAAVGVLDEKIVDTATDAHLGVAAVTSDPITAAENVHAADAANRVSAQKAAEAAAAAKSAQEKAAAAQSAAKVIARDKKIADAWAKLGAGQCEVHTYAHVTQQLRDVLIARLHAEGMTVTGDNPWNIDTHQHDVKLRAIWDFKTQVLKLIVTAGAGGIFSGEPPSLVCPAVWAKIDPIMKEIVGP